MATKEQKDHFFSSPSFGVVGASNDRGKFGNKVLRTYLRHNLKVYPINPHQHYIKGLASLTSVSNLPEETKSISIITPPKVTEEVVKEAIAKGIENIWMQPGAESPNAVKHCVDHGVNVIADGTCILVELG